MRGQFYIISATVIVVIVTSLVTTLQAMNPNLFQPISDGAGFSAYNFQRSAADITKTVQTVLSAGGRGGMEAALLSNFTEASTSFAGKNGLKVSWRYAIRSTSKDNTTITYNMSFSGERASLEDTFTVTRLGIWRQTVNVTGAPGPVTVKLDFPQNRVANCTREIRVYDKAGSQVPAKAAQEAYNTLFGWRYQIPVVVSAGAYNRTDALMSPYVDFTQQLMLLESPYREFDINSVRVVEYDEVGRLLRETPSQFLPSAGYWYQTNATGNVLWVMNGSTPAGTSRYYSILFDTNESGSKPQSAYATDLTVSDRMSSDCYIEVATSKALYRVLNGACKEDENTAGGLKNAWITGGSGHDLIEANDTYGQYFNATPSSGSGPITYYSITGGAIASRITYKASTLATDFTVNITAYSSAPYYRMDVAASNPWSSEFSPVTEHHGGSLCEYRNDSAHRWAEVYSNFWGGEGYGIVGLNATVTDLLDTKYSCSRIRHRVSSLTNWTIYTIFRTPQYTAEDLYHEKSDPPAVSLLDPQPYSGYCTTANVTFDASVPGPYSEYRIYYGYTSDPPWPIVPTPALSSFQILPEEDVSRTLIY